MQNIIFITAAKGNDLTRMAELRDKLSAFGDRKSTRLN